jgi:hypothetical protein
MRSVSDMSMIFHTGFNTCMPGHELTIDFRHQDVKMGGCLDASHFVPAGSVKASQDSYVVYSATSCGYLLADRLGL